MGTSSRNSSTVPEKAIPTQVSVLSSPSRNPTAPSPVAAATSANGTHRSIQQSRNSGRNTPPLGVQEQHEGEGSSQWNQGYALQYLSSPRHHLPLRVYYCSAKDLQDDTAAKTKPPKMQYTGF